MATTWQIGDRIQNRWEIFKILRGGMGVVYIVYDHEGHSAFAAKTFQDEALTKNLAIAHRFEQEALSWINLDAHQNVTRAHFVQNIESRLYLFLEYVSGGDLGSWIGTPRLTEDLPQVLRFAIQFCDGMTHALAKGIKAHRDIKPQNCLITEDSVLKVTDFGLAKLFDDSNLVDETPNVESLAIGFTRTGSGAGTCTHMAPEQFEDAKHVDVRADIYSFGVMVFQMLSGELPFVGSTWGEFEHLHRSKSPPPLRSQHSALSTAVQTCLAKDPARRFATFEEVRNCLAEIYERLVGEAAPHPAIGAELGTFQWSNKGLSLSNLGLRDEALDCFDRALELNPHAEEVWVNKGATLYLVRRLDEAVACFNRALELNPSSEKAWLNKGVLFGDGLGRWKEAITSYDRALELNPYYDKAWHNKGMALKALESFEEAIPCFDEAIRLNPRYKNAWSQKGVVCGSLGRHKEAISCLNCALALNPDDQQAWYDKGVTLSSAGEPAAALICYERALELDPRFLEAWYNRGVTLGEGLGRWLDAIDCYDQALALNADEAEAWYSKGVALWSLGKVDEGLSHFNHALQLNPDYVEALTNKGAVLGATGQITEAVECLDRALELNSHFAAAWFNKGVILLNAFKRYREALTFFEEAQLLGHPPAMQAVSICRFALANDEMLKGFQLVESEQIGEAMACFEEALTLLEAAERLGHPKAAEVITLCRTTLRVLKNNSE